MLRATTNTVNWGTLPVAPGRRICALLRVKAGWHRVSEAPSSIAGDTAGVGPSESTPARHGSLAALSLGALGVVYGDIGTSPLYALRECFSAENGLRINEANVLGVLSLMVWALIVVVCVKYVGVILRADNQGEGGVLALLSLTRAGAADRSSPRPRFMLLLAGLFGAGLLYGDSMITPAISVLSAVEGLGVATHAFDRFIIPITIAILIGLFAVQKRGTARVAAVFGPFMLVWFLTIGGLGVAAILGQHGGHTSVLAAANPLFGLNFLLREGMVGFMVLGSVVLVITGGEALYADMGHFGRPAIQTAWFVAAFPALLLNYLGQGVLLLEGGATVGNPFFEMAPSAALYPLVALATGATIIASQALISGAFSLTQGAMQLGYAPRFTVVHTSGEAHGQIYVPAVNRTLMVLCILLVLGFKESSELADAYGMAVTGTMSVTSLLFYAAARERWGWSRLRAGTVVGLFLIFDLAFLVANAVKFLEGGWVPLAIGALIFVIMTTWKRGREEVARVLEKGRLNIADFMRDVRQAKPHRVPGTAVVLTANPDGTPLVLLHHFKHNKVLHEQVVLLTLAVERQPEIPDSQRVYFQPLGDGFYRVIARFGFMEQPKVDQVLRQLAPLGLDVRRGGLTFILGRETLLPTGQSGMAKWRKQLFTLLMRNAPSATAYFEIPANQVVELGAQTAF